MGYVEQNLLPGEHVEYQARLHWIIYWPAAVLLLLALVGLVLFWPVGLAFLLFGAIAGGLASLRQATSEFAVTNRRVLIKVGLFGRHTLELLLPQVETVAVDQGFFGRIFGYGNMTVKGTGGTQEPYPKIARPLEFRRHVQQCATALTVPPVAPAAAFQPAPAQALAGPFCIQCGARNSAGARFCNQCGKPLMA